MLNWVFKDWLLRDCLVPGNDKMIISFLSTYQLKHLRNSQVVFPTSFSSLDLKDVKMKVNSSKNSEGILQADKQTDSLRKLKPKNCDCNFPAMDSTRPMPMTSAVYP